VTNWTAFAGFSGVVVALLLLLARASQSLLSHDDPVASHPGVPGRHPEDSSEVEPGAEGEAPSEPGRSAPEPPGGSVPEPPGEPEPGGSDAERAGGDRADDGAGDGSAAVGGPGSSPAERSLALPDAIGTAELLANVLVTHGLFALLVVGGAVFWQVPASALGVSAPAAAAVAWGVAAGLALYVADEVGAAGAARFGVDHDESLRALLAPDSRGGWVLLLGGVLPVIAVSEELLFRGVLIGALAAGFGLPPWWLALGSSVVFALGHGAQGRGGVVVTGLLGVALAAAFVVSGSLLVVVVAHYVVNALEFAIHEGLGVEWTGG
jgi:membrane protease YdiL (CAAX protease family)